MNLIERYKKLPVTVKATFWAAICGTIQKGISVITTPIFTRLLSTEEYGFYTAYNSWFQIFVMVTTFNLTNAVFNKGLSKYSEDKDGYMSSMLGTTTIITGICFVVYLVFHRIINDFTELGTLVTVLMFAELLVYPAYNFWIMRRRYDFKYRAVVSVTLCMAICNAGIGILAVLYANDKGLARVLSVILVNFVFGLFLYIKVFSEGRKFYVSEYAKFSIIFNIPLIPHYLSTYILDQSDRIMIQKMCGLEFVGIYGVAYSLGLVMKIFTSSIGQSLIPWEYRQLKENKYNDINKQTVNILIGAGVLLIMFMAVAPEAMHILAPDKYMDAIYIVPSVTASVFFMLAYNIFSNVEFYFDANKFTMVMSLVGALLNLVLNYIFIQIYGYIAAGYTTLFCYIVFTVGHFWYCQSVAKKKIGTVIFDAKKVITLSIVMTASTIGLTLLYDYAVVRYALLLMGIIIAYLKRNSIIQMAKQLRK